MPFPYTFPFSFEVEQKQLRQWQFEVRDASGNLIRIANAPIGSPKLRMELNAPSELRIQFSAYDVSASALSGQNEIWILNRSNDYTGKFRIIDVVEHHDNLGPYYDLTAVCYLAQLGAETMQRFSMTGTVSELAEEMLLHQVGENQITLGDVAAAFSGDSYSVYYYEPTTILRALQNLSDSLDVENRFYIDSNRLLQWEDISATTGGEKLLWIGKNAQSVERRVKMDAQTTRLYPYGSQRSGAYVRISDADGTAQRWRLNATAATTSLGRTMITIGSGAGYDTPGSLDVYTGQNADLQAGDLVVIGNNEYEIRSVATPLAGGRQLYMFENITSLVTLGALTVIRPYLDAALRGAVMRRLVTIDHTLVAWNGATDYGLTIAETDPYIAAYTGTKTGLGIKAFSTDYRTEYTVSVASFNTATGAYSATVTVPEVSGVVDTRFYLVFGRF